MPRRLRVPRYIEALPPEEQLTFMRSLPAAPFWQRRLAALPEWDGTIRFPHTGDNAPWSDEELQRAAWDALRGKARGAKALETKTDPNDPPIVGQDIQSHPRGPYGPSPGYLTAAAGERASLLRRQLHPMFN